MKYMLIMRVTEEAVQASKDMDFEEVINAMGAYNESMMKAGVLLAGEGTGRAPPPPRPPARSCQDVRLSGTGHRRVVRCGSVPDRGRAAVRGLARRGVPPPVRRGRHRPQGRRRGGRVWLLGGLGAPPESLGAEPISTAEICSHSCGETKATIASFAVPAWAKAADTRERG